MCYITVFQWSYGVVLWELLTRGCSPYPNVNSFDIKIFLASGHRMERPDYAPDEMYVDYIVTQ